MSNAFEYFEQAADADLSPFIECIWGVRAPAASNASGDHTAAVLPNGAIELMVNFGPVQQVVGHGDRTVRHSYRRAWVAGIQDRRLVHCSRLGADHISVRFRPGGAHAFFGLPMRELANQVVELEDLIGSAARELRDDLGELGSDAERTSVFQGWLRRRLRVRESFVETREALALLAQPGERRASVRATCERLGLTNRYLVDEFCRTVGLVPNVVGRIARLQDVIKDCDGQDRVDWRAIALDHGYADQSHLIREFQRFGSVTPRNYLRRRAPGDSHFYAE